MLGNFTLTLPTRVHFGDEAFDALPEELARYGSRVLLTYGGKSAKATGLYDRVIAALADAGKEVREVSGSTANPTIASFQLIVNRATRVVIMVAMLLTTRESVPLITELTPLMSVSMRVMMSPCFSVVKNECGMCCRWSYIWLRMS